MVFLVKGELRDGAVILLTEGGNPIVGSFEDDGSMEVDGCCFYVAINSNLISLFGR
jgi:hypothetical protein